MKIAVRYFSRSGNTKKVAEAIAKAAGVEAKDCSVPIDGGIDLLFLGGAVYGGKIDKPLMEFIEKLEPQNVKCAALFGTSAIAKNPGSKMEKILQQKNIPIARQCFYCYGAFAFMRRGRPNEKDLKQAAEFASALGKELSEK